MSPEAIHTAGSLQALVAALHAMESECGEVVESLSREFQSLAARISKVLGLAGLAAESIEAGAVPAIPGKVETLVEAAARFVRDRIEGTSAVLEVVANEQELVEALLRINARVRSIAKEIRMVSVLTGMEVARLGEAGSGFQYLVQELQADSEIVADAAGEFSHRAKSRNRAIQDTQRKIAKALPRLRKQFQEIESQLQRALADVKVSVQELSACPAEFKSCVESVAGRISGVVTAIQSHDITRQQNDHVRDALTVVAERLFSGDGGLNARETTLALRVQVFQLENIRQAMGAWSSQIDECLESILNVSQSRLERVAPVVIAQEKQLFSRLVEIEQIEKQCEDDSSELQEAFSGLSAVLALVREHSQVAQVTRDRLRLLSFNSIVESRNLGGKADVMLEISRNITRIASEWGQMAETSASTQAEIQRLMDQAHAGVTSLTQEKARELETARLDILSALANLQCAAQCTAANAAEMGELTAALKGEIKAARSMSRSLKELTVRIGGAIEQLDAMRTGLQASVTARAECDLSAMEEAFSRAYTTETERSILRAVLYGEALPVIAASGTGNDVELF